jgi:hypothetical protein
MNITTKDEYNYFFLQFLLTFRVIFKFEKTTYFNLWKNNLFSSAVDSIIGKHTLYIPLLRRDTFSIHFLIKIAIKMTEKTYEKNVDNDMSPTISRS